MVLADECSAVTSLTQHLCKHRCALGNLPTVAWVGIAYFRNDSGSGRMVIATSEQGRSGWGAESRGVKPRVAQAHLRQAVEIWRGDLPPERAPLSESRVIDQDI